MRVQVCTPTYLEAENIEEFLRRARAAMPGMLPSSAMTSARSATSSLPAIAPR